MCGAILAAETWLTIGPVALAFPACAALVAGGLGVAAWRLDWPAPAPVAIVPTAVLLAIVVLAGVRGIGQVLPPELFTMFVVERVLIVAWVGALLGLYAGARRFDTLGE